MKSYLAKSSERIRKRLHVAKSRILRSVYQRRLRRLQNTRNPNGQRLANVFTNLQQGELLGADSLIDAIEKERKLMLLSEEPLIDGTLGEGGIYDKNKTVARVCDVSKGRRFATFLYLLAREFKPQLALELGTNVGISSAYHTVALKLNGGGKLITLESSPYQLRLAKQLHEKLGLKEYVAYKIGLFADTLEQVLQESEPIDYAFIDGHHLYQPTLDYFNMIWGYARDKAIFVFDDISTSTEMKQAWHEIKRDKRIAIGADFGSIGVCVITRNASGSEQYVTQPIRLTQRV